MKNEFFPKRDDDIYYRIVSGVRDMMLAFVIVFAAGILFASIYLTPAEFVALRMMIFGV